MPGIGVVMNPRSRRNLRRPETASLLRHRIGDAGVVREARSVDELHRIAEEFLRTGIDVLAICGGDGTNTVTLTGFLEVYGAAALPAVALLRGGTMNTLANSVGVPRRAPEKLLTNLVRSYSAARREPLACVERDVMSIRAIGEARARSGFLFGAGVVYGYLAEYYAAGASSPWTAATTLARGVGSAVLGTELIRRIAAPFRGTVAFADGSAWPERDYLALAAGTIAHIGLGFQPFYRFAERQGAFHVLGIHAPPTSFVVELPRILAARPMREGKAYDAVSDRMLVRSATPPLRYMIDGDLHEAPDSVEVTTGRRVRLIPLRWDAGAGSPPDRVAARDRPADGAATSERRPSTEGAPPSPDG
ncbi:MAG TPA: diacylglycerol kinase family protein [Polyangiaceae bacterium]|nr:diacylglycerol kinase family protein [Polyangiaceae bacterium]